MLVILKAAETGLFTIVWFSPILPQDGKEHRRQSLLLIDRENKKDFTGSIFPPKGSGCLVCQMLPKPECKEHQVYFTLAYLLGEMWDIDTNINTHLKANDT